MNIKSLLIGSAAVMAVTTGARAADTVVFTPAEPEPMEYVRICDVYGAGFFYIPGTETCLKLGGYFRYEIRNIARDVTAPTGSRPDEGYTKFTRFQFNVDARSETALGTLRGYAELRAESNYGFYVSPGATTAATPTTSRGYYRDTYINQMFIELQQAAGTWRLGLSDTPYARFLGYGGPTINDGSYGFNNAHEFSYTFTGSNGFSAIAAVIEDSDTDYTPDFEAGFNFVQGWGSIGAIAGYDESAENYGAKVVARFNVPNTGLAASVHVFYSDTDGPAGQYTISGPGGRSEWSVLAGLSAAFTPTVTGNLTAQWFDSAAPAGSDSYQVAANINFHPVENLAIIPEVVYSDVSGGGDEWYGLIRIQRSF